jgi:hypothetical protein
MADVMRAAAAVMVMIELRVMILCSCSMENPIGAFVNSRGGLVLLPWLPAMDTERWQSNLLPHSDLFWRGEAGKHFWQEGGADLAFIRHEGK